MRVPGLLSQVLRGCRGQVEDVTGKCRPRHLTSVEGLGARLEEGGSGKTHRFLEQFERSPALLGERLLQQSGQLGAKPSATLLDGIGRRLESQCPTAIRDVGGGISLQRSRRARSSAEDLHDHQATRATHCGDTHAAVHISEDVLAVAGRTHETGMGQFRRD